MTQPLTITFLPGGWLRVDNAAPGDLYVRVSADEAGRLRIRELYLDADAPLTGDVLRGLPMHEIEGLANLSADDIARDMDLPGGDRMRVLASRLGAQYGRRRGQTWAQRALEDWVCASWLASFDAGVREQWGVPDMRPPGKRKRAPGRSDESGYRLTAGPTGRTLDHDFLTNLARAYGAALARGERPNVAIARDSGYPRRTVESWVLRARQRGYLPPARKGAAG